MISEYEIIEAARRYSRSVHAPVFEDLAVYLLITVGHFRIEDVRKGFDIPNRTECLAALNRVSVAYITRNPKCVRDVVDKAKLAICVSE